MADNKDFTHASGGSLTRIGDGSKRKARWVAPSFEIVSVHFLPVMTSAPLDLIGRCDKKRGFTLIYGIVLLTNN
jgi:hypothetical protein